MIPKEILAKIKRIEVKTRRLVSDSIAGRYHSVFRGQGINFSEVREYQPGDDVRSIDWNVTARMNHPFVKIFTEERELTVILMVDISASGWFGSGNLSKRELAAEIGSVLTLAALRNQDKVGLALFSDEVEQYVPPRKGSRHALRIIREILCHEPRRRGTNIQSALDFLMRVVKRKCIVVLISDFLGQSDKSRKNMDAHLKRQFVLSSSLNQVSLSTLRQVSRRHDVIAIQTVDRFETELPNVGYLTLKDAETGEVVEINTGSAQRRKDFANRQERAQKELDRLFRSAGIDAMQARTDQSYAETLIRFFQTRENRLRHQ